MLDASQKISNSSKAVQKDAGNGQAAARAGMPDPEQIKRLLNSAEGQSLLRLLQADGGAGLRAAAEAMKRGNVDGVKAALSPLLAGTQAEALSRRLEEKL